MLQWMGGSRRKVTSTRMSTQKRQKQYFEQKRRQQQAAGGRKDSEEHNIQGQHAENSRSLDILSFQNLSTVAQQNKSNYPLGNDETEHHALNYQTVKCPQSIQCFQANKFTPSGPSEAEEARLSSIYQLGGSYAKTMLVSTSGKDARTFNSDDDKMNQIKMVPGYQELGMMDILGDDEPNLHTGSSLEREAHAAFSIEGVGRVEMETPVHTPVRAPEVHGRNFSNGCSPPSKAMRPAYSFNLNSELVNLEFELDAMMQEVDLPLCKSSVEHSFCSKDILGSFSKPKQDLLDTREFSIFDDNDNGFTDLFQNDEPFFHKTERNRHSWDATCRPLTGKIRDESAFGSSCNNWMDQEDASDDYHSVDCRSEEITFQGSYRQKSRTTMRKSKRLGHRDSPELYVKRQNSENFHDSTILEMTWRSPVQRDHDVGDIDYQPTWSCFRTEDTRDNLSLLSEESCSSSAVRSVSQKGTLNSTEKQTPKSADFGCSENICGENIMYGRVKTCNKLEINQQGDNTNEQGKLTRISNSSRSQPADNSKLTSEKRLKSENGRLFEGAYDPGKTISRHNPYPRTYDTNPSSRLWIEDLFGTSGGTNVHADCSPCCNLTSEEHDSHQRKLEKVTPMSSMLNSSEHCNRGYKPQKSMHGHSFPESEPESELQSITREEDEHSDLPVSEHGKLEHWRENSRCRKSLFSGCGKFNYVADVEDKSSNCKESTIEASKLSSGCRKCTCTPDEEDKSNNCKEFTNGTSKAGENVKETDCLQDEDASPSGATSSIDGDSSHVDAKCQLDAQSSFLHQTGSGANLEQGFGHEERTGSEEKSSIESTCQVTTLDSCVLQLLCIQVLKEASAKVTGKKA